MCVDCLLQISLYPVSIGYVILSNRSKKNDVQMGLRNRYDFDPMDCKY